VVKCGADGALWATARGDVVSVPALVAEVVDPTGAGDAFAAAYLVARSRGRAPRAAAARATRVVHDLLARAAR
jgi:sugar/nucleoside kinase (ribokinase family)